MPQITLAVGRRTLLAGAGASVLVGSGRAFAADPVFRFGLALPLTGPQALFGADQIQAATWGIEDINKAGGVNGKKLEMIVLDTQADPQVGIQAVNRLVNVERVPIFVIGWSSVAKAAAPIANDHKVLQIVVGANSPAMSKLGEYVYTTYPLADVDLSALAKYLTTTGGKKRAAVLYVNDETGTGGAEIFRDRFKAAGGEVVAFEAWDNKATDFTGQILKARSVRPDVIHIQAQVSDTPQVIAQMRQLGITATVTSSANIYTPRFIASLGAAAEGVIATSLAPSVEDSPKAAAYVERWKTAKGREPNGLPYTQYLYDQPYLVAAIFAELDKAGTAPTGDSFRAKMLEIARFDLPLTGRTEILADHSVRRPVDLMQVTGGKWTKITTMAA